MPGKQSEEGPVEAGVSEDSEEEGLGGLTLEELQQGQEAARALEDMMALSAQTLVRAEVDELYEEVRPLGQGRYGRVLLVTHRQKGTPLALKQLPKPRTSLRGFLYEFCVGLSLGVHSAIVTAYGIGIESAQSYSFLTEPVLHGDLMAFIQPKVGLPQPAGVLAAASPLSCRVSWRQSCGQEGAQSEATTRSWIVCHALPGPCISRRAPAVATEVLPGAGLTAGVLLWSDPKEPLNPGSSRSAGPLTWTIRVSFLE
ncbi:PREDICTED: serine/threonine-protein kinase SBK2 [Mandrillus leucophaeus]|uniref:serine/threonine-protein kinase SBK2 n=1 Tax=Mandrillus leucophaeus TaxID=9568 RepID=UPI0005F39A72|nr:PREDICTED: serine/threonine-protein kinase SBK2 [Mandrillus leucophaeus]